jgi:hypothetical protein
MMARRPRALLFAGAAVVSSTASDERAYSRRFWTLSHQSPADFPWFGLGADVPQPALWMQSTSISTCHSGSMKRATPTKVQAGRISPNTSPWARAASCHQSMTVSIPRVRTTSSLCLCMDIPAMRGPTVRADRRRRSRHTPSFLASDARIPRFPTGCLPPIGSQKMPSRLAPERLTRLAVLSAAARSG